jgi:hypothetical protein
MARAGSASSMCARYELPLTQPHTPSVHMNYFDFVLSACLPRTAWISCHPHGPRARVSGGLLGPDSSLARSSALFFTGAQPQPGFLSGQIVPSIFSALSLSPPPPSLSSCHLKRQRFPVPCYCLSTSSQCFVFKVIKMIKRWNAHG